MTPWRGQLSGLILAFLCLSALTKSAGAAEWPQAKSDIPADPAVHFGRLDNGMLYAIMPNALPAGQVSFRLRIDAGSLQEDERQQGLAHFLEHMAFRGSTHVPDHEAFHLLERFGAAPGADSNAFTEQSETVYKIDLPKNSKDAVDTALMFLRETASEMTLSEAAVNSERPVVLSEERLRDNPAAHLSKIELGFVFQRQPIGNRLPIGDVAILKQAKPADLRRYYRAFYRPERAMLVVVGDVSAAEIEADITSRFGAWRGQGPAGRDPVLGPPLPRGQEVKSVVEAGAPSVAAVEWTQAADPRPDSVQREADEMRGQLALAVLNQRLLDRAHGEAPPFLSALGYHRQMGRSGQ